MLKTALAIFALLTVSAGATEFGAISYSTETGSHGYSHNYPTQRQAERVAQRNCLEYADDCEIIVTFYNTCAALAVGNSYGYGYAYAPRPRQAQSIAMANCRQNDNGCQIVRRVCSR